MVIVKVRTAYVNDFVINHYFTRIPSLIEVGLLSARKVAVK